MCFILGGTAGRGELLDLLLYMGLWHCRHLEWHVALTDVIVLVSTPFYMPNGFFVILHVTQGK